MPRAAVVAKRQSHFNIRLGKFIRDRCIIDCEQRSERDNSRAVTGKAGKKHLTVSPHTPGLLPTSKDNCSWPLLEMAHSNKMLLYLPRTATPLQTKRFNQNSATNNKSPMIIKRNAGTQKYAMRLQAFKTPHLASGTRRLSSTNAI